MHIENVFASPVWSEDKPEFIKSLNKASDFYVKDARKRNKSWTKKYGDFGGVHNTVSVTRKNDFLDFKNYIGQKAWEFLDAMGYDMSLYRTWFTELWIQEFSTKGGGHQSAHIHRNQHVSGCYFLKCSEKTAHPIFHDPKTGARSTKLKMKPELKEILLGNDLIHYKPKPGALIIFPGYMEHEYSVDHGREPFRFIHFNLQAVPKEIAKDGV